MNDLLHLHTSVNLDLFPEVKGCSQCCSLQCLFLLSEFCRSNNICPVLIYHSGPSELVKSEQLSVDINQSQLHDDILDTMMHKYVEL